MSLFKRSAVCPFWFQKMSSLVTIVWYFFKPAIFKATKQIRQSEDMPNEQVATRLRFIKSNGSWSVALPVSLTNERFVAYNLAIIGLPREVKLEVTTPVGQFHKSQWEHRLPMHSQNYYLIWYKENALKIMSRISNRLCVVIYLSEATDPDVLRAIVCF